jgi:hypothetical protein
MRGIAIVMAALGLLAAGCGGGNGDSGAGQRRGFRLSSEQRTCLEQHGAAFGGRGFGGGPRPNGTPPAGATPSAGATPPAGQRPTLTAKQRKQFAAQREKMQAAFKTCGIKLPQGRGFGGPGAPEQ